MAGGAEPRSRVGAAAVAFARRRGLMGSVFWLVSRALLRLARSSREAPGWRQGRRGGGFSCEDGEPGPGPRPCGSLPHWSSPLSLSLSSEFTSLPRWMLRVTWMASAGYYDQFPVQK